MLALVVIALTATLSVRPLLSGRDNLRRVQGDDQALQQLLDLRASFADLQIFMEPQIAKFSTTAIAVDPAAIATGSQIARDVATNTAIVTDVLQKRGLTVDASAVATESAAFTASLTAIGTLVTGQALAVIASTVATERAAFNAARDTRFAEMRQPSRTLHANDE